MEMTYREAVRDALSQAMRRDDGVFIMGEDIAEMGGSMGVTQGMFAEFGPERVRNTPISEMAIVGAGIGAAMQGMRPVVEIMYEDFTTLAMEQLVNQAAKHRYMSGGQVTVPLDRAHAGRCGLVAGCAACSAARGLVRPRPRPQGRVRLDARPTCAGCSGRRSTTTTPFSSSSTGRSTRSRKTCPMSSSRSRSARRGRTARGGRDRDRDRPARARGARRRPPRPSRGHLGRGRRPAHAPAARRADARRVGQEDEPRASSLTRRSCAAGSARKSPP